MYSQLLFTCSDRFLLPFLIHIFIILVQFLEIALVRDVGMCVCPHPLGYKFHSCNIEPV